MCCAHANLFDLPDKPARHHGDHGCRRHPVSRIQSIGIEWLGAKCCPLTASFITDWQPTASRLRHSVCLLCFSPANRNLNANVTQTSEPWMVSSVSGSRRYTDGCPAWDSQLAFSSGSGRELGAQRDPRVSLFSTVVSLQRGITISESSPCWSGHRRKLAMLKASSSTGLSLGY